MTMTRTKTDTHTVTVTSADVREVMRLVTADIRAICQAAAQAKRLFDLDESLIDVSVMVVQGLIESVSLAIEVDRVVVREYKFRLVDGSAGTLGPPAGQPPLGPVPAGTRLRLYVFRDPRIPLEEYQAWIKQLGWSTGEPLVYANGVRQTVYGAFKSGGLAVERSLKSDPAYDRPWS